MEDAVGLALVQIFVLFLSAKIGGEMCKLVKQPEVLGELFAGIILGGAFLGFFHDSETFDVLAEIGVIILLFGVGLETRVGALKGVRLNAALVAIAGVFLPFALGYSLIVILGGTTLVALFIGAAMVATSIGITARILMDMDLIHSKEARIILGAAIIDDILGLIVLTVVSGLAVGQLSSFSVALVVAETMLFVGVLIFLGKRIVDRVSGIATVDEKRVRRRSWALHYRTFYKKKDILDKSFSRYGMVFVVLLVCFGLSALASYIGLAAIIGAFFAGLLFAGRKNSKEMERQIQPIKMFFVPFFFVIMGTKVIFNEAFIPYLPLTIAMVALAIVGKFVGGAVGTYNHGRRTAIMVGAAMVPRGEVGIIVAMVGLETGIVDQGLFTAIVLMSIVTTLWAPPLIKIANRIGKTPQASTQPSLLRKKLRRANGPD
ncbi:MAG: cation:proton antiporter [Thermoplasmata archaeon]